jgi:hypothetical protein
MKPRTTNQVIKQAINAIEMLKSLHEDSFNSTPEVKDIARGYLQVDKQIEQIERFINALKYLQA